jgi:hypothetical protein
MRIFASFAAVAASLVLAAGAAGAGGSVTVDPSSVHLGDTVTVTVCGLATGQGGYYEIGNSKVDMIRGFGPADSSCLAFPESTSGWATGRYRVVAFVFTAKGTSRLGATSLTVAP